MNYESNKNISNEDFLDFFSSKSNVEVIRYWKNNRKEFFNRYMIICDPHVFIIADKESYDTYEIDKPPFYIINKFNKNRLKKFARI
ncbi:MAG: hypothetical protein PUE01_08885 [Clostridiaceae bacterium]|nr:hypothetical protein [Clostridiaceae bacterium]